MAGSKKNLKMRIKRVISLSILFSILFFTLILSLTSARYEKNQGYLLASMLSSMASSEIFSTEVLDSLGLESFQEFNNEAHAGIIIKKVNDFENNALNSYILSDNTGKSLIAPIGLHSDAISDFGSFRYLDFLKGSFKIGEIAQIKVSVGDKEIYKSDFWGNSIYLSNFKGKLFYRFIEAFTDFFKVEASYHVAYIKGLSLPGAQGQPFAAVTVRLDPGFLVSHYSFVLIGILFSAAIALLISNIAGKLLSSSVSNPFAEMDLKLKSLALEDYETTLHSQIIVKKRALKEIKSISGSTNTIISKMQQFNSMQVKQKNLLESKKDALEIQREELLESRQMIQEAQSQLIQSQNMASIGQLTAAISHEINEPLDNIRISVETQNKLFELLLADPKIQNNEQLRDLTIQLKEAGALNQTAFDRISSIISSLKNFSRLDQSEMEEVCINENIRSVVLLTSNLWKRIISMHENYGDIPLIRCYAGLINQVFMNILVNAIHAIPEKGDIFIKTWSDDDFILVSIKDTGIGISENNLKYIFETGFTTKKSGKGSGLGLSISKSIIDKHNGKIDVISKEGEGSEFIITLPLKQYD